ncbi:unnamed protein product [Caenorhabditis bovis]|uniref:BLOC-1-related complex subunit 5 n=1 Tax=Caenorhabditis bovis TaxID=2654633 RepID=A0A8S1FB07_9PELO|nr:unnamed protein product [Caenorhabditis bovis]
MLPSITGNKLRWQRSTRRLSYVKLPALTKKHDDDDEAIPPDPKPSEPVSLPRIVPSLCIDNQYFVNYTNDGDLTNAFHSFAKIHGDLHRKRQNYFEKRGFEEALQLNIDQQNNRIGQAIECLAICEEITKKYQCGLESAFNHLVDDLAEKCFKLSSITSKLYALRQTHLTNL